MNHQPGDRQLNRLVRENVSLANARPHAPPPMAIAQLKALTRAFRFSVALGDLLYLEHSWYVTHQGLMRLAMRRRCSAVHVERVVGACDPAAGRWVFRATIYKTRNCKGFVGYGDANPSNVSQLVRGAELRVAETRSVNRALRKAYGIGLCSVEELVARSGAYRYEHATKPQPPNGSNNGQPRLKDKLCLLIRQHNLDPTLVKGYAAHFCGTETLRGASRELVESFIAHLEKEARENRDSLLCKLNSFSAPVEVHS